MLSLLWSYVYYVCLRRMLKWCLRLLTGKCELQRITESHHTTAASRIFAVEHSLRHSKHQQLNRIVVGPDDDDVTDDVTDDVVHIIAAVKKVDVAACPAFVSSLRLYVSHIVGYQRLMVEVEHKRRTSYSSDNDEHEALLMQLWSSLQPDVALTERHSPQWTLIGFQGSDPATDFRGMGLLGLLNLLYFSSEYGAVARKVLSRSAHPQLGYSYAVVGINMTSVACHLLRSGALRSHFYNAVQATPQLTDFHDIYVYLFYEFDKFWFAEAPADIMQFNIVKDKFVAIVSDRLRSQTNSSRLTLDFTSPPQL